MSSGATMASALKSTPGAAIRISARYALSTCKTSGWFWLFVPSRFHINGTASRRRTSTPTFAKNSISAKTLRKTSALV